MFRYPNPLRLKSTSKTGSKSNLLRTRIETQTKRSRNGLKFNTLFSNTMTTANIYLQVVLLCLGTQILCGRNQPPKQEANLTFLRTRIETKTKRCRNGLKFNIQDCNKMPTQNINLQVVLLCIDTQTLCGRNETPKDDANLTFYVLALKPRRNDLEMA